MPDHPPSPLEYQSPPRVDPVRPAAWLSHMRTAAILCPCALFVDSELRYEAGEAHRVAQVEVLLAVYGATCAVVAPTRGSLTRRDKVVAICCCLVFLWTSYAGLFMPRVIHN